MRIFKVGVCDKDPEYVIGVMEYINSNGKHDNKIEVIAFTSMQAVSDYLEHQELGIILTDDITECSVEKETISFRDIRCLELTEYKDRADTDLIFKYQNMDDLCNRILQEAAPKEEVKNRVSKTICVFSPLGRCGKTKLSKALAACDYVRGGLYVGLEEYAGNPISEDKPDILYQVKQRLSDLDSLIDDVLVQEGNIKILRSAGAYFDIRNISREDIEYLNNVLFESGRFSTLVYDIGGGSLSDFSILECFDEIYVPILEDEISKNKEERFEKLIKDMGHRALLQKIIKIKVPVDESEEAMIKALWDVRI